ncbi:MAG: ATP-binding cassette domain-containing protein, partial [Eggerthellaceae bacterium]|nr:ATP-binding cassette domain-containing protein [Eggerthellaceae bacterium]
METVSIAAPALLMRGFSFAYPRADAPVLDNLDMAVEQGEFVLLTGDTGSGKTTLLRCFKPEITPVGERSGLVEVRGTGGYVSQNPETQIVCDTVWHEMAFGLENA